MQEFRDYAVARSPNLIFLFLILQNPVYATLPYSITPSKSILIAKNSTTFKDSSNFTTLHWGKNSKKTKHSHAPEISIPKTTVKTPITAHTRHQFARKIIPLDRMNIARQSGHTDRPA